MPGRIIRDGWLDADKIRQVGEPAEVLLLRLMLVADDYGRSHASVTQISRRCWPAGDDEGGLPAPTNEEIAQRLAALADVGLVVLYQVAGKPYLYVPNFRQRSRSASKFPDPPPVDPQASPQVASPMTDTRLTNDGQASGTWRAADGGPRAQSKSMSKTVVADVGHVSGKPPTKPMLPATPVTATQRLVEESRQATANAKPPPYGSAVELLKQVTRKNGGTPPPDPAPREPGEDPDERTAALDTEAESLGMQRIAFESDEALQHRITARRALG